MLIVPSGALAGARQVDLLVQFLVEALTLALLGGGLGILAGLSGALVVPRFAGGVSELSRWPSAKLPVAVSSGSPRTSSSARPRTTR